MSTEQPTEKPVKPSTVTKIVSGVMRSAYNQELKTPINYSAEYEELTEGTPIPADEQLSAKELLDVVNTRRRNNARQKAMQAALDAADVKKPTLEDTSVQRSTMLKVLLAAGKNPQEAEDIINGILGAPPAE